MRKESVVIPCVFDQNDAELIIRSDLLPGFSEEPVGLCADCKKRKRAGEVVQLMTNGKFFPLQRQKQLRNYLVANGVGERIKFLIAIQLILAKLFGQIVVSFRPRHIGR